MYISPISPIYGYTPKQALNVHKQDANNYAERHVEYSLWNSPSFGRKKKREYSSEIHSKFEKPGQFKIGRIPNLTCPACGQKILTRSQYERFLGEIRQVPEEEYIPILDKYKKYMCPTELEVFNDIKEEAERVKKEGRTPHLTDIVKTLRVIKLPELEKIQLEKVEDMREAIQTLPRAERDAFNKKFDTLTDIILNMNKKAPFRRKILIESVKKYEVSDPYVKEELIDIAESFPSSAESACAWIVKNAGKDKQGNDRSPLELAEKLVSIASTSTDHILARNIELNHDDITNYMAMHKGCNSEKTDKSFNDWFYEDPVRRKGFLRTYLREVKAALDKGKIKDKKYRDYVKDCVLHIYNLSDGKVDFREEFCPETIPKESQAI